MQHSLEIFLRRTPSAQGLQAWEPVGESDLAHKEVLSTIGDKVSTLFSGGREAFLANHLAEVAIGIGIAIALGGQLDLAFARGYDHFYG